MDILNMLCARVALVFPPTVAVLLWSALIPQEALAQEGADLTAGAVFAMSNAREGNTVVAYYRNANGTLVEAGRFETGGRGSGSFEDSANSLVLGTMAGEISPNNLVEPQDGEQQFLFVTNPGSNEISVFAVHEQRLELLDVQRSDGEKPISVTVNNGLVYVLDSGETNDNLFDAAGNVIVNCTTGKENPTIQGFRFTADGQLHTLKGSGRKLSGEQVSGCAQVTFDPTGQLLVVTERLAQPRRLHQQRSDIERLDDEGLIVTFRVDERGRPHAKKLIDATGQGPFGFTFKRDGDLLTTEQFDGPLGPGRGAAASYVLDTVGRLQSESDSDRLNGKLLHSSPSIKTGGTDTCWFVVNDDQTLGFATSFFGEGRISSFEIDEIGLVRLIQAVATGPDAMSDFVALGASDIALSRDSAHLYQLNSIEGTISVFLNNGDGTLTLIEQHTPFPQPSFGPGGGEAAPIGLAAS